MIRMFKKDGGYMVFSNEDEVLKHLSLGWEIVDNNHGRKVSTVAENATVCEQETKKRGRQVKK